MINGPFSWLFRQTVFSVGTLVTLLCINPKMDFLGVFLFFLITVLSRLGDLFCYMLRTEGIQDY